MAVKAKKLTRAEKKKARLQTTFAQRRAAARGDAAAEATAEWDIARYNARASADPAAAFRRIADAIRHAGV